jgi:hypothetical protein
LLAERLGARLFDEGGVEVTASNIDAYLDLKGPLVTGLHSFWKQGQQRLHDGMEAPLEFPLGAFDHDGSGNSAPSRSGKSAALRRKERAG